jgi:hypothetical protein
MADGWYCEIAGREIGPLSPDQLRAMAAKGQILPNDCVRQGEHGSWILARQVKGLLPPPPKPAFVSAVSPSEYPQAAQRPPQASAAAPPPPAPVAPPQANDVFDVVALGIVTDDPVGMHVRKKLRMDQQQMLVGLLVAAIVGLAAVGLLLAMGSGSSPPGQSQTGPTAPAKKASAAKAPVESPDALDAREGIESLDSPKPTPLKTDLETPKSPPAAQSDRSKTAPPGDSTETVPKSLPPKKKSPDPKPATSKADSGLPQIDGVSQ